MPHPSQHDFLRHIEHECRFVIRVCTGKARNDLINDELLSKGNVRSLEIIGEATKKLDIELKSKYSEIEWKKIAELEIF